MARSLRRLAPAREIEFGWTGGSLSLGAQNAPCPELMSSTLAPTLAPPFPITARWIISRRMDLIWFIGAALAGYGMFFLHAGLGWDMVTVWFFWVVLIDSPHFFGTISRTFLDREEFRERRTMLLGSLLWYLAGPAVLLLGYGMYHAGVPAYDLPWKVFLALFSLWAYWHVVRQHYGFLRLYQRKNDDVAPLDFRVDGALLYGGLLLPYIAFILRHPDTRVQLGLDEVWAGWPAAGVGAWGWDQWAVAGLTALLALTVATFLVRQVVRVRQGIPVNVPKMLFLLAVVPLHVYVCLSPAVLTTGILGFTVFVTIFHDFQYHAIVWFHHKNRYHKPGVDQSRFGWAPKLSKNLGVYFGCALFFALLVRLFGCSFEVHPGCGPFVLTSDTPLFGSFHTDALLKAFLLGFALQHYFVDQFIWKPSKSKALQADLKLKEG